MAGHSKWKKIQHNKARVDFKKSQLYTRMVNRIFTAAIKKNTNLAILINIAKIQNIPNDIIERTLERAKYHNNSGEEHIYEICYKSYAILLKCLVSNKNKISAEIKSILKIYNAAISDCKYLFYEVGYIIIQHCSYFSIDDFLYIEGIQDIRINSDIYVYTQLNMLHTVYNNIINLNKNYKIIECDIIYIPYTTVEYSTEFSDLINILKELDYVIDIYTNVL